MVRNFSTEDFGAGLKSLIPSRATIKERCTSVRSWELPKQDSALAPDYVWTNKDMDPVPPEDQVSDSLTFRELARSI